MKTTEISENFYKSIKEFKNAINNLEAEDDTVFDTAAEKLLFNNQLLIKKITDALVTTIKEGGNIRMMTLVTLHNLADLLYIFEEEES